MDRIDNLLRDVAQNLTSWLLNTDRRPTSASVGRMKLLAAKAGQAANWIEANHSKADADAFRETCQTAANAAAAEQTLHDNPAKVGVRPPFSHRQADEKAMAFRAECDRWADEYEVWVIATEPVIPTTPHADKSVQQVPPGIAAQADGRDYPMADVCSMAGNVCANTLRKYGQEAIGAERWPKKGQRDYRMPEADVVAVLTHMAKHASTKQHRCECQESLADMRKQTAEKPQERR